ncbi:MAG: AMP-binding protein [Rhodocyclaceae bacterium]
MTTLAQSLQRVALDTPDTLALLNSSGSWSYGDLLALARRGAGRLLAARPRGARIAAVSGTASELALASYQCAAAGLGFMPLDAATAERRWPTLRDEGGDGLWRTALPASGGVADEWSSVADCRCDDIALVIATSGSEGMPKAVMLSRGNLAAAAEASNERIPLNRGDVWLACLPLHHIGGISILHRCARAGATVLLHEGFDAVAVWRDVVSGGVTHISLVPAMLARLLDVADRPPPSRLRYALIGGAALSRPLFDRAVAAGWPLCPSYGLSECAAQVATLVRPAAGQWVEGAVGALMPGGDARIGDDGRLRLRGPQVMLGYLNPQLRPGLGLDEGEFVTSDLARFAANGSLTIIGRADDVLVTGGVNVHPLEVESCLAGCPGVADVAITAIPDPVWGDLLVALVVGPAEPETVQDFARQRLASPMRPRRVVPALRLPRNPMGKLDRAALPALAKECA